MEYGDGQAAPAWERVCFEPGCGSEVEGASKARKEGAVGGGGCGTGYPGRLEDF